MTWHDIVVLAGCIVVSACEQKRRSGWSVWWNRGMDARGDLPLDELPGLLRSPYYRLQYGMLAHWVWFLGFLFLS